METNLFSQWFLLLPVAGILSAVIYDFTLNPHYYIFWWRILKKTQNPKSLELGLGMPEVGAIHMLYIFNGSILDPFL